MTTNHAAAKGGFSLVEVCLAVMVMGLGIMSIFSLFPTGLAASEAASGDTVIGLHAEQVLFGLQAKATDLTWDQWVAGDTASFAIPDVRIGEVSANVVEDPIKEQKDIAYFLDVSANPARSAAIKQVVLYVLPWRADTLPTEASLKSSGIRFYTELSYMELPE